jgi:hypothetical protein
VAGISRGGRSDPPRFRRWTAGSGDGGIGTRLPKRLGLVAAASDPTPRGITSFRHGGGPEGKLGDDGKQERAQEWQGLLEEEADEALELASLLQSVEGTRWCGGRARRAEAAAAANGLIAGRHAMTRPVPMARGTRT